MTKKLPARGAKKLPYLPRFAGAFQGRAYNVAKAMYPKLAFKGLEFDDLLQEAALVFFACRAKYQGKVDNPAWFMALFCRSLHNRFVDLQRSNFPYIPFDEAEGIEEPASEQDAGFVWRELCELPADIRDMLGQLFTDDAVLPALTERVRQLAGQS